MSGYVHHLAELDPRDRAATVARLDSARLRELLAFERTAGRAFGTLAEACRLELAKRTGMAAQ